MGLRGWILLSRVPEWRWLRDRGDSPWYPTLRLARQTAAGDWETVLDQVRTALEDAACQPV